MKFLFLLLGVSITLNVFCQSSPYSVKIICKDTSIKKIEFLFIHNDSSFSIKNKILYPDSITETNGKIAYPYAIYLRYNGEVRSPILFIEKGNQTLIVDSLNAVVKVQNVNLTNQYYQNLSKQKSKTNAYVELWNLYFKVLRTGYSTQNVQKLSVIKSRIGENETTLGIENMLRNSTILQIGKTFPTLSLLDLKENQINLEFSKSKFTLIDFWFAYCTPCIGYFNELKKVYPHLSQLKVVAVSIDMEKDKADLLETIQKYNYQWENLWDRNSKIADALNIHTYPKNFLVDSQGKILAINIELQDLKKYF